MTKMVCTGACLLGKCPFDHCIRDQQGDGQAIRRKVDMRILSAARDLSPSPEGAGFGVSVDIGTTTLATALYDFSTGKVIAQASRLNRQTSLGLDVISRIKLCMESPSGLARLNQAIVQDLSELLEELTSQSGVSELKRIVVTGNTTMLHLFAGISPEGMGTSPFTPASLFGVWQDAASLQIRAGRARVYLTDCISSFVGGDITTALLWADQYAGHGVSVLLDIGTNGEIALNCDGRLLTASTAAGPAFEGGEISCGMAGIKGAVCAVRPLRGNLDVEVIGGGAPKGLCGSGLLDAVALMLEVEALDMGGALDPEHPMVREGESGLSFSIAPGVSLTQKDVRELQTAKAAIAAGLSTLLDAAGLAPEQVERVYLAGGFGNFLRPESALRIGLLPEQFQEKIQPIGNAALMGASRALLDPSLLLSCRQIARRAESVDLAASPYFMQQYVECMLFPE